MAKLTLRPFYAGLSIGSPSGIVSFDVDGGLPRMRRAFIGGAREVQVSWRLTSSDYNTFETFFGSTLQDGALPFQIDLPVGGSSDVECDAVFVPDSKRLDDHNGDVWFVSAKLRVKA